MQTEIVKRLINHAILNPEPSYNLDPLIRAFLKLESTSGLEIDLWVMHHLMRPYFLNPHVDDGDVLAGSLSTFLLASSCIKFVDDPRNLGHFHHIKIHTKWIHDVHLPVPITRLTQRTCWDMLLGLDWFTMSDVFSPMSRSEEVVDQIKQLLKLLQMRLFYLIHGSSFDVSIIDMKDERDTEDYFLGETIDTTETDYSSDTEQHTQKKDTEKNEAETITVANVGLRFLYNLEAIISNFHTELKNSDEYAGCEIGEFSWFKIGMFRKYLETMLSNVDETWLMRSRMDWQHSLQVHIGQERMFRRINGIEIRSVRPRQVIVNLNDDLITQGHISRREELLSWKTGVSQDEHRATVRISTDAMFWAVSEQGSKVLRAFFPGKIWRDRVRNRWMVRISNDRVMTTPSLTHSFFALRYAYYDSDHIDGVDVSAFNSFISTS